MSKYQVKMLYPNGEEDVLDELFDSYEDAEDEALYNRSCYAEGARILNMSNPGDYPLEDSDDVDYEITEIK